MRDISIELLVRDISIELLVYQYEGYQYRTSGISL